MLPPSYNPSTVSYVFMPFGHSHGFTMFTKMNFCYYVFPIVLWGHALAQFISVSYCPLRTEKNVFLVCITYMGEQRIKDL